MGLCGTITTTLLVGYLCCVALTLYNILYPGQCTPSGAVDCLFPLFNEHDTVFISVNTDKGTHQYHLLTSPEFDLIMNFIMFAGLELYNHTVSYKSISIEHLLSIPIDPIVRSNVHVIDEKTARHVMLVIVIAKYDTSSSRAIHHHSHTVRIPLTV